MVRVDFTQMRSFSDCPRWWQNFVLKTIRDNYSKPQHDKNLSLNREIEKCNGTIIDCEDNEDDMNALEFETEDDMNAFKVFWTLHGS
jgi:hypothetical protein